MKTTLETTLKDDLADNLEPTVASLQQVLIDVERSIRADASSPLYRQRGWRSSVVRQAPFGSAEKPTKVKLTRMTDGDGNVFDVYYKRGDQYEFEELPYIMTSIGLYKFCYQNRVRGEARSVLDWLLAHIETDNIVLGALQRTIEADTGIHQSNVSAAMRKLESLGLILRGEGAGQVWLNPRLVFIGQPPDQKRCIRKWDERRALWTVRQRVVRQRTKGRTDE